MSDETIQHDTTSEMDMSGQGATIAMACGYAIADTNKKKEEKRTEINKQLFLETLAKTKGVIYLCCEKVGIVRQTFYNWRHDDPIFDEAVRKVEADRNNVVEDILIGKITLEHDGACTRYYLDRKHPEYKPHVKVETQFVGDKTLEDLIDADKQKHEEQSRIDRGAVEDQNEARPDSAVQTEPGANPVEGTENPPQSDTESPTGGAK